MRRIRRAFTLIELTAVMMIIAIMLVLIIPNLDNVAPAYRMGSTARRIASEIELAHSSAISNRAEYVVAYDLESQEFWLISPQRDPNADEDSDEADPNDPLSGGKGGELDRPTDDVEHGGRPPDRESEDDEEDEDEDEQEKLDENEAIKTRLPDGVAFVAVVVDGEEKTSGTVYVRFTKNGNDGGHMVGLKIVEGDRNTEGGAQQWVKFNPITNVIEYHEERPTVGTLSADDAE